MLSLRVRQIHPSAWLLVALSAILQVLIFPLPGVFVLSWVALAPLIVALLRARPAGELEIAGSARFQPATPAQAFLLSYVCGILWYAGTCYWIYDTMRHFGGLSTPVAVLVLFLFCCYLGLYHGFFGLLLSLLTGRGRDLPSSARDGAVSLGRGGAGAHARHRIPLEPAGHRAGRQCLPLPHRGMDRRLRHLVRNCAGECGAGRSLRDSAGKARRHAGGGIGSGRGPAGWKTGRSSSGESRSCGACWCSKIFQSPPIGRQLSADIERVDRTQHEVSGRALRRKSI